jgi:hypothetical protein
MLRLNMAVPPTPRNDPNFSTLGLVQAAVLGLTDPTYANTNIQFIPNMDGFPNGRRLEDDVTRIELQAVGGVVLAAIGLWYDDYIPGQTASPVTPDLLSVLTYDTGISANDTTFKAEFPYVQTPWSGTSICSGEKRDYTQPEILSPTSGISGLSSPEIIASGFPNPFRAATNIKYRLINKGNVKIQVYDTNSKLIETLVNQTLQAGEYQIEWQAGNRPAGVYNATILINDTGVQTLRLTKSN